MSWSAKVALALIAAVGALVWLLGPILTPFVLSAGLAYLGDPVADRLERARLSRTWAVVIVFTVLTVIVLSVLGVLVPMLLDQLREFIGNIPRYVEWLQEKGLPGIGIYVPAELRLENLTDKVSENLPQAGGIAKDILGTLTRSGGAVLAFLAGALLVPVVTFYLMRDWDRLVAWVDSMIPRNAQPVVRQLARETDEVLSGFLRGQLLVMLVLGVVYSVGLWLVGVKLSLLIGLGAGLVSFVPYLGFIAGLLAAGIAVLVQTQEFMPLLYVLLVFAVGQVLESSLLTPWLVGDRIGLHPVAVIFAVMAGAQLFGFVGMLLGLPVAAIIAVLLRYAAERWRESTLYLGS